MIKASVLTVSDKGSVGDRKDSSGPEIEEMLKGIVCQYLKILIKIRMAYYLPMNFLQVCSLTYKIDKI